MSRLAVARAALWPVLLCVACARQAPRVTEPIAPAAVRTSWDDASGARNGRVAVDGTTLHYIDYGGVGQPLVFLAGLGNTAHIFDDFAPRFTDRHRVVAFTRRGYGESGRPHDGFHTARLAADVIALLDSLQLQRVVLVGHSVAGSEVAAVAASAPERVASVVFLDAAYDRAGVTQRLFKQLLLGQLPPSAPRANAKDRSSVPEYRGYLERVYGVRWPEQEVRARHRFDREWRYAGDATAGKTNVAVARGEQPMPYARVVAPTLSIYSVDRSVERDFPWIRRLTIGRGKAQLQAERASRAQRDWERDGRRHLTRALPSARVVELRDASHYLFISHADTVETIMRAFLAGATGGV